MAGREWSASRTKRSAASTLGPPVGRHGIAAHGRGHLGLGDAGHRRPDDPGQLQAVSTSATPRSTMDRKHDERLDVEVGEHPLVGPTSAKPRARQKRRARSTRHAGHLGHLDSGCSARRTRRQSARRAGRARPSASASVISSSGPVLDEEGAHPAPGLRPSRGAASGSHVVPASGRSDGMPAAALEPVGTRAWPSASGPEGVGARGPWPSRTSATCWPMGISTPWAAPARAADGPSSRPRPPCACRQDLVEGAAPGRQSPTIRFRLSGLVQVATRSPTPAKPADGDAHPPSPRRDVPARPGPG